MSSILFYTLNYKEKYFVFAGHASKRSHVRVEYLNDRLKIADEDEDESFKAYLIEVLGTYTSEPERFTDEEAGEPAPEELQPFLMIYIPTEVPALFAINEKMHDGLARLNISFYEKSVPLIEGIFHRQIEKEDLPDPAAQQMPADWIDL
ncbi:MAG TPA: hypothetical protein V6D23_25460 [Candidatus Obscuribacterales bacterium]